MPKLAEVPVTSQLEGDRLDLETLSRDRSDLWTPRYWFPERLDSNQRLTEDRINHLRVLGVDEGELEGSLAHAQKANDVIRGVEDPEYQGNYAFIAPTRIERGSTIDYTEEGTSRYPVLRSLDQGAAQVFLASQPPFLIDHYGDDPKSPKGVMIFAPLFMDMLKDFEADPELLNGDAIARIMNPTVSLARDRLGVQVAGLAAVLPALTKFGNSITERGVKLSTGHAGTVWALEQAALKVMETGLGAVDAGTDELAIMGLGGIGLSTAIALRNRLPDLRLHVYDNRVESVERARDSLNGSVVYHDSVQGLFASTPLIVSAITGQLEVETLGNVDGTVVIDDSQPGSVPQEEFRERGGKVVGVYTDGGNLTRRNSFHYAGFCAVGEDETFSCHANVAAIAELPTEEQDAYCFRRPVCPDDVARIEGLFGKTGVKLAPLQWGWGGYHTTDRD